MTDVSGSAPGVRRVGVVGAGTMGAGIAQIACRGGYETRLHDPVPEALEGGLERLKGALYRGAERGRWSRDEADAAADRVGAAPRLRDLAGCDLVVEAAPEDLGLKRELFAALAAACGMGWFDGNPAHLWEHPPVERARRYVESMGGAEAVLERARGSFGAGDYRWVAELVNHLVFAEPENRAARELQADALEQLGYGAENATWRNFFLAGAGELREGVSETLTARVPPDIVAGLSVAQLLDAMAIRLDGPRAWEHQLRIDWVVTEPDEAHAITVRNGVLRHRPGRHGPDADATLIVTREALDQLVLKTADLAELAQSGRLRVEGDGARIGELLGLLDEPDPGFPIVTPA